MDEKDVMFIKSAFVSSQEISDDDMRLINKHTLTKLENADVFTFKVAMCDNEVDRDYECFTKKTLQGFKKLFLGKPLIKDHVHSSNNQVGRIYDTFLVENASKTATNGEAYTSLVAKCYIMNTEENKSLIASIKGGIIKEVSICAYCEKAICSICGTDNKKEYCRHFWGREYDGQKCYFTLEGANDAYELSLVAVPAQKDAKITKSYGIGKKEEVQEVETEQKKKKSQVATETKAKLVDFFIFTKKQEEK